MSSKELKPKRKTFTSNEVKKRYNDKTYASYTLRFRKKEDADIIDLIESGKEHNIAPSETIRRLIRNNTK